MKKTVSKIIKKLGGLSVVTNFLGISKSTPYDWKNGIPKKYHLPLLSLAQEKHVDLRLEDFYGIKRN